MQVDVYLYLYYIDDEQWFDSCQVRTGRYLDDRKVAIYDNDDRSSCSDDDDDDDDSDDDYSTIWVNRSVDS